MNLDFRWAEARWEIESGGRTGERREWISYHSENWSVGRGEGMIRDKERWVQEKAEEIGQTPLGVLLSVRRREGKSETTCRWPGGYRIQQWVLDFRWGGSGTWCGAHQGGSTSKWRWTYLLNKHLLCGYSMPGIWLDSQDAQWHKMWALASGKPQYRDALGPLELAVGGQSHGGLLGSRWRDERVQKTRELRAGS